MQYRNLGVVAMVGGAMAAYVPSEPWSTLTPSATLSGGTTDFSGSFGIAINQIATSTVVSSSASASATLDVKEHKDRKAAEVTQIGDGQIQAATSTSYGTTVVSAAAITQIGDGQIQAATSTVAPSTITTATKVFVSDVITQIGDGQIQAATSTAKFIDNLVTQIGDGQIQATTATTSSSTAELVSNVVTQIGDGQIQATTATTATGTTKTTDAATQIGDGQVQATTASGTTATESAATQIGDGQVQQSSAVASSTPSSGITLEACASDGTLSMKLHDGILTDSKGRIGSIVANQQFQFDGPPPQAGAIYAAGWSISSEGKLAIGNTTTFYECLSGDFYNLYHKEIGSKCYPVELDVVELVSC